MEKLSSKEILDIVSGKTNINEDLKKRYEVTTINYIKDAIIENDELMKKVAFDVMFKMMAQMKGD